MASSAEKHGKPFYLFIIWTSPGVNDQNDFACCYDLLSRMLYTILYNRACLWVILISCFHAGKKEGSKIFANITYEEK